MIKLASWNINSIKVRLEQVVSWLQSTNVDVLALQETKVINEQFPAHVFRDLGYHVIFSGQKSYNGVAIISKIPLDGVLTDIPGLDDLQRRILVVNMADVRLINLYVPNGSQVGSEKYLYKLEWLEKVTAYIEQQLALYPKVAVVGDFNIAPEDKDVHDPKAWEGSVLVSPLERQAFFKMAALGLHDSFRLFNDGAQQFTWWDYRAAGFRRNLGLRIDHILLSGALKELCLGSQIDIVPRRAERPSDHAPIWVNLNI